MKTAENGGVALAIRLRVLGDVLATLGTLRSIKETSPQRRIAFVVDARYHALLKNITYIDLLVPEPPRIDGLDGALAYNHYIDGLRQLGADTALDFHSNVRSALLTYMSGAATRVGFDVRGRKILYTDVEPRAVYRNGRKLPRTSHEAAMALARRSGLAKVESSPAQTISVSTDEIRAGRQMLTLSGVEESAFVGAGPVGLNPGNPYPAKKWEERSFVEVARALTAQGRGVVLMWGPGEKERAQRIVDGTGEGAYLSPRLELEHMCGVLKNLSALVTIDSGLKHLAVAAGVPTITLFGPTDPLEWHMGGRLDRYVSAGLSCSPCRLLECPFGTPCMSHLKPADVLRHISAIEAGGL
jgi:ADP-heptose:LPS heptosyltransferase